MYRRLHLMSLSGMVEIPRL